MKTRFLACLLVLATPALADVRLPAIIGPNMVLQQKSDPPIWGWDKPGQVVTVGASWAESTATATADDKGRWIVRLHTPAAGAGPYAITIQGSSRITLDNILLGEVWLCSGQSNMEMAVGDLGGGYRGVKDWQKELADANYGGIRLFDVPNVVSAEPRDECGGAWAVCSPERVKAFSATGYFFGRELHKALNVPIGLISADWGGTVCEAWASEHGIEAFPEFRDDVAWMRSQRGGSQPDPSEAWHAAMDPWWGEVAQKDPGSSAHWEATGFDDSAWGTMDLPGQWKDDLSTFDGILWMRRIISFPESWAGKPLELSLGPIDDMDTTYLDGNRIGGEEVPGHHDKPRLYSIPSATPGPHTLAIRILDTGGPGGVGGNADQCWVRPTGAPASEASSLAGTWKFHKGASISELPPIKQPRTLHANTPMALYNGMIAPVIPYGIRGAIWYQGESNRGRADQYAKLFPAMISDWRWHWGLGDFPFYFVQIAPFGYGDKHDETALLREAQLRSMATPNTGMACTMDIGNPADIHPNTKQEVGRRLSLWALAKTYGQSIECSGPIYDAMLVEPTEPAGDNRSSGGVIRLRFAHAAGLNSHGEALKGFQIAGVDGAFVDAKALVDGETVVVSSESVPRPTAARYGWGDAIQPNLFNGAGLPAAPFRTGVP